MGDYTGEHLVGLNYDAMFPTEEGSVSLVGGTCFCPVPSWASLYSFPLVFPQPLASAEQHSSFLKLSWSGLYEVGRGRLNHTPLCPWLLRPENQSCEEPQWAARAAQVWGWGLEIA